METRYDILDLDAADTPAGPFVLLGLEPQECDRETVRLALARQLARIDGHPHGRTIGALRLRLEVQAAADMLLNPVTCDRFIREYTGEASRHQDIEASRHQVSPSQPTGPRPARPVDPPSPKTWVQPSSPPSFFSEDVLDRIAPARLGAWDGNRAYPPGFQRDLLAAWVSAGGWNGKARHRIVAAAAPYGVSGEALMEAIVDLPGIVSSGIGVDAGRGMADGGWRMADGPAFHSPSVIRDPARFDPQVASRDPQAEQADDPDEVAHRIAMRNFAVAALVALAFALFTIPFGMYVLNEVMRPIETTQYPSIGSPDSTGTEDGPARVEGATSPESARREGPRRIEAMPITFRGALDQLARDLLRADADPSELLALYERVMGQARRTWMSFDDAGRDRIRDVVITSMYQKGGDAAFVRQLLDRLDPPAATLAPDEISQRAWSLGMLAILSAQHDLPASATAAIEQRVRGRLGGARPAANIPFNAAALLALEHMTGDLVRATARSDEAPALWLAWVESLDAVAEDEWRDRLHVNSARRLLVEGPSLPASPSAQAALTALFLPIDWRRSEYARQSVLSWFDDARISSGNLSIVTAFLVANAGLPGLDETFILAPQATSQQRAAGRERLSSAWGASTAAPSALRDEIADWIVRARRMADEPPDDSTVALFQQLLTAAHFNLAAEHLWENRSEEAARTLRDMEQRIAAASVASGAAASAPRVAQVADDGRWSIQFFRRTSMNDRAGRADLLDRLGADRHGNLGPVDAGVLANIALTGQPREIRLKALEAIENRFSSSPTVLLALTDNMIPDRADSLLSETIMRLTGGMLPPARDDEWYESARSALLKRIAELRGLDALDDPRVESLRRLLAETYAQRASQRAGSSSSPAGAGDGPARSSVEDPAQAAQQSFEQWLAIARPMLPSAPVPGSLRDVTRRAATRIDFYDDPIGAFHARQLGILETAAYVTSAERPEARETLRAILRDAADDRAAAQNVMEQLVLAERALSRIWMVRFGEVGAGLVAGGQRSDAVNEITPSPPHPLTPSYSDLAQRLTLLDPSDPREYFLLAEDAADLGEFDLATRLFVLAATLDPSGLGRSACLALADLAAQRGDLTEEHRLRAMAHMGLNVPAEALDFATTSDYPRQYRRATTLASAMLGFYRRGDGQKALAALDLSPITQQIVRDHGRQFGFARIVSFCRNYSRCPTCRNDLIIRCPTCRGGTQPGRCGVCAGEHFIVCNLCRGRPGESISEEQIDVMLRFEVGLLAGRDASWSSRLELDGGRPRAMLEPERLGAALHIDTTRVIYRDGEWTAP